MVRHARIVLDDITTVIQVTIRHRVVRLGIERVNANSKVDVLENETMIITPPSDDYQQRAPKGMHRSRNVISLLYYEPEETSHSVVLRTVSVEQVFHAVFQMRDKGHQIVHGIEKVEVILRQDIQVVLLKRVVSFRHVYAKHQMLPAVKLAVPSFVSHNRITVDRLRVVVLAIVGKITAVILPEDVKQDVNVCEGTETDNGNTLKRFQI